MNHPPITSSVASDLAVVWCYVRENQAMTKTQFCCRLQKYFLFPLSSESSFFSSRTKPFWPRNTFYIPTVLTACPTTTTTTKTTTDKSSMFSHFQWPEHTHKYILLPAYIYFDVFTLSKNPPSKPPLIYFFYLIHPLVAVPFGNPRSGRFSMHRSSVFFPHFVHWVVEVTWTLVRTFCSFFSKIFSSRSVQELQDISRTTRQVSPTKGKKGASI